MADISMVLCVGTPAELRHTRLLVLQSAGYEAHLVEAAEAIDMLRAKTFDVLLLSVTLSMEERSVLRQMASERTRIVQLEDFTAPDKLLALLR